MTSEEFKERVNDLSGKKVKILDDVYDEAYLGISADGRVVYSYDRMIECVMLNKDLGYEEAINLIDSTTIKELKKLGNDAPIVLYDDPIF